MNEHYFERIVCKDKKIVKPYYLKVLTCHNFKLPGYIQRVPNSFKNNVIAWTFYICFLVYFEIFFLHWWTDNLSQGNKALIFLPGTRLLSSLTLIKSRNIILDLFIHYSEFHILWASWHWDYGETWQHWENGSYLPGTLSYRFCNPLYYCSKSEMEIWIFQFILRASYIYKTFLFQGGSFICVLGRTFLTMQIIKLTKSITA